LWNNEIQSLWFVFLLYTLNIKRLYYAYCLNFLILWLFLLLLYWMNFSKKSLHVFWNLYSFPSITPLSILFSNVFSQTDRRTDTRSTQKYSTGPHKNGEANFTHEWPKANFTHVSKRTLHTILRCELYTRNNKIFFFLDEHCRQGQFCSIKVRLMATVMTVVTLIPR